MNQSESGRDLMRKEDVGKGQILLVSLVASVVIASILPFVLEPVTFYESVAVIAAPFVVLGIWDLLVKGRWIVLAVCAALALLSYFLDWRVSVAVLMLTAGSFGIASSTDLVQRWMLLRILEAVEHGASRPKPTLLDRAAVFMFDVPSGLDARNMKVNRAIVRDDVPWRQLVLSMIPTLVLMVFLWMFAAGSIGFRSEVADNSLLALAITMYFVAAVAPCFILSTMDVRIEYSGASFRLFDGLIGTCSRMALPALLALVVVIYAADPGWNAVLLMLMSAAFCAVVSVASLVVRSVTTEAEFVEDAGRGWAETHPVDFYSGFDGRDGRYPLDDGVPCTPRRPADACFDQKN